MDGLVVETELKPDAVCRRAMRQYLDQGMEESEAVAAALERADDEPTFARAAMIVGFVDSWRNACRYQNREIKESSQRSAPPSDDVTGIAAHAERNQKTFYDTILPRGALLGDASPEQVDEAISIYIANAHGNLANVGWLRGIRKAMGKHKCVRDGVTLEIIANLRRKAEDKATKAVG